MRIHNIVVMILIVGLIMLLVNGWPPLTAAVTSLNRIGPGHATDDKVTGLITLGLIGAVLVALVRILNNRRSK